MRVPSTTETHDDHSAMAMAGYYRHVRREILPLLPESAARILDVGAGGGGTLRWLKTIFPTAETTGVELNPALMGELKSNADFAICGSIDDHFKSLVKFDLIVLLDVLEHLQDSLLTLKNIRNILEPNGRIIVSLPNVSHLSVSVPLLFNRRFEYSDAGILDRTHLRFFVERTAVKLLNDANFFVKKGIMSGFDGPKSRILKNISFGLLRHHLTKQYIMLGEPVNGAIRQQPIHWEIG